VYSAVHLEVKVGNPDSKLHHREMFMATSRQFRKLITGRNLGAKTALLDSPESAGPCAFRSLVEAEIGNTWHITTRSAITKASRTGSYFHCRIEGRAGIAEL
jgi:hypothetical protein